MPFLLTTTAVSVFPTSRAPISLCTGNCTTSPIPNCAFCFPARNLQKHNIASKQRDYRSTMTMMHEKTDLSFSPYLIFSPCVLWALKAASCSRCLVGDCGSSSTLTSVWLTSWTGSSHIVCSGTGW